jgi:hypothetical protein
MKPLIGRLCLAVALMGACMGPASADECIAVYNEKTSPYTEFKDDLNGQCPIFENNICFDRLRTYNIVNTCQDSFNLLITGGTKTEKAFLSAKSSRPFSCLEAHNSCTGIQVQELDRKGRPKKESTAQSTQLNLSSSPHDDDHCLTCVSD